MTQKSSCKVFLGELRLTRDSLLTAPSPSIVWVMQSFDYFIGVNWLFEWKSCLKTLRRERKPERLALASTLLRRDLRRSRSSCQQWRRLQCFAPVLRSWDAGVRLLVQVGALQIHLRSQLDFLHEAERSNVRTALYSHQKNKMQGLFVFFDMYNVHSPGVGKLFDQWAKMGCKIWPGREQEQIGWSVLVTELIGENNIYCGINRKHVL